MKAALSLSKKQHKNITALFLAMVLACVLMVPTGKVWGQTTVTCYPPSQTYATGYTTSSTKTSGNMQTTGNSGAQGWMKFDVSPIPNNAIISSIELHFYNTTTNNCYVKLTSAGMLDPVSATASELYSAIINDSPNYYTSTYMSGFTSSGWKTFNLSTSAVENLQNSGLTSDYFTIGFHEYESSSSYYLYAYGYSNSSYKPYITVTYTLPAPATIPYTCDFETSSENAAWTKANATDGWFVGNATYSSSSKSLYVSNDNGTNNTYAATSQYIYAYRELTFATSGDYDISYKWKCKGESTCDYMRVFLVPKSINPTLTGGTSNSISTSGAPSNWITADGNTKLNLNENWTQENQTVTIPSAGNYYLVFYWRSDVSVTYNPPAAVDDISIKKAPPAPASIPYACNFEDATENSKWTTENSTDGWFVGSATCNSSSKSLYVSPDNGSSNTYGAANQYIYAYRVLDFTAAGDYLVSYKWKCQGESSNDYMRVFLIPKSANPNLTAGVSNSIVTSGAPTDWIVADGNTKLNLNSNWATVNQTISIPSSENYYLVFYWRTDGSWQGNDGTHSSQNPPPAVDDIAVVPVRTMACGTTYSGTLGQSYSLWAGTYPCQTWTCAGEENIYVYTPPATGEYTFTTTATSGDPDFFLMPTPSSEGPCVDSWDEGTHTVSLTGGNPYYLIVDNGASSSGYTINVSCFECPAVEVGDLTATTTNNYLPSYSFYNTGYSQQIYTPCEIGVSGNISSVAFYNGGSAKDRKFDIYLVHTNKTEFSSTTDWIPVTAADKVYSGTSAVTMTANAWTKFNFDVPFVYDGVSNLAVIIDDNTESYSSGMSCRVYEADGNQAIYQYDDNNNNNPTNPLYEGTLSSVKNQLKFGICDQNPATLYIVSASANSTDAGTVSGLSHDGCYASGNTATITAVPTGCYKFANWTENGSVVSTNSTYSFTVTGDRTLVANFEEWSANITSTPNSTECLSDGTQVVLNTTTDIPVSYNFTATTSSFNSISGSPDGTSSSTGDAATLAVTLPFVFNLAGKNFAANTSLTMRCDGFVTFGSTWGTNSPSSPSSSHDVISPLGYDQNLVSGESYMYYKVTGSEGSRVLTMEWKNMRSWSSTNSAYNWTNYQVKLHEGSNIVELCYGSFTHNYTGTTTYTYISADGRLTQITSSYANPVVQTNTTGSTTSIMVNSASATPANGTVYRFTPPQLSYTWSYSGTSGTTSGSSYTVSPTELSNTYTVSATLNGCTKTTSQTVTTVPTISTVTSNAASNTICNGSSATLSASSNASSLSWNNGAGNGASVTVSPSATTSYTVTASANGCTNTGSITITVNDVPTLTAISAPAAICAGNTLTLTAPTVTANGSTVTAQGWQYSANGSSNWNTFSTSTQVPYSYNGYYLRYYATNGCGTTYSNTVQMTVNPLPVISSVTSNVANNTICGEGNSATLTANSSNATSYSWSNGAGSGASVTVAPTSATTYTVTAAIGSCTTTGQISIDVVKAPVITATPANTECITAGTQVTLKPSADKYAFNVTSGTYSSISGTSSVSGDDNYSSAVNIGFTFNYWGVDYTTATIATNGFLKLGNGSNGLGNDLASTTYYNYLAAFWDDLDANSTQYTTLGTSPNRVFVMQHNGYRHSDNTSNTFTYQIRLYETTNVIEFWYGSGFPSISNSSTSASIGLNNYENGTTSFISVTPTGIGTATSSTTTSNNSIGTTQCDYLTSGTIYRFTPLPTPTYAWSYNGTAGTASGSKYTVSPTALSSTYTLSATLNGCTLTDSKTVTTTPVLNISSSAGNAAACGGSEVELSATSNASNFTWSDGAGTTATVTVHPEISTIYHVTASSGSCTTEGSVGVTVINNPTVTITPDPAETCIDGTAQMVIKANDNFSSTLADYEFSTGTSSQWLSPSFTTIYSSGQDDEGSSTYNIGFTFNFAGIDYTQFSVNTNGSVRLGASNDGGAHRNTPFSSSNAGSYSPKIIGVGRDLGTGTNGYVKYGVYGTQPNRILVCEFATGNSYSSSLTADVKWQVQLFETSNKVQIVYYSSNPSTVPSSYQIGMCTDATDVITINPSTHTTSTGTTSTTYSSWPGVNRYYRFTPPTPPAFAWSHTGTQGSESTDVITNDTYTVTPAAFRNAYTVTNSATGCSTSVTLDLMDAANITAENVTIDCGNSTTLTASGLDGVTYNWYSDAACSRLIQANNATLSTPVLNDNTTYYVKAVKGENCETQAKAVTVTVNKPSVSITELVDQTICDGESFTFNPQAMGNGELSYHWSNGNTTIGEDPTYAASTAGTYLVTVTSTVGNCSVTENTSATLTVNNIPSLTDITAPAAVHYGSTLSLTAPTVTDNGSTVRAQGWEICATQDGNYTAFNPTTAVGFEQDGYFLRYYATNGCGTTTSNAVQITINKPILTTSVIPSNCGSISCSPMSNGGTYDYGTSVQLTATPSTGYTFQNWTIDGSTVTGNPATITMNVDHNAVANFTLNSHNVTYAYTGDVPAGAPTVPATVTYNYGANVPAAEVPTMEGYTFSGWSGEVTTMPDEDVNVTGSWTLNSHNVTYAYTGNVPTGAPAVPATQTYNYGANVPAAEVPTMEGYTFSGWSGEVSTMPDNDVTVTGSWTLNSHNVTYAYTGDVPAGAPTVPATVTYNYGANVPAAEVPTMEGYTFSGWSGEVSTMPDNDVNVTGSWSINSHTVTYAYTGNVPNGAPAVPEEATYNYGATVPAAAVPTLTGYTFSGWSGEVSTMPDNDVNVTGSWSINTYTITASANPNEGGNVSGADTYNYGATATLYATANAGYSFVNWTENDEVVSTNATYSFMVTAARTLVANFTPDTYTIAATANPAAGGTITGAGTYEYSSTATLIATPSTGYRFVNWTENGNEVSTNTTYIINDISSDHTLVANFEMNSHTVAATANPSNGGTITGAGTYEHGATATLTATANTGYTFDGWYENSSLVSSNAAYSFTVTAARTLEANFSCVAPSNLTAGNITATSATLNWEGEAESYNVRYRTAGNTTTDGNASLIFSDDFESGSLSSWTTIDADGNGHNWTAATTIDNLTLSAHSGSGVAYSQSYDNSVGDLSPNNWLITPQVQLGGYVSFWAVGQDPSWSSEHFAIYVSTTGTNPADFTSILSEHTTTGEYVQYTADLSDYSGLGYVAIRHFNCSAFILNVDDFELYGPSNPTDVEWITVNDVNNNSLTLNELTANTEYEVQVQSTCNTTTWSDPVTFTTLAQQMTLTVTGGEWTYDGTAHTATVVPEVTEGTTLWYRTSEEDEWSTTEPSITNVGSITVYVKATHADYSDATGSCTLTVTPANLTITAKPQTYTYNGSAQGPAGTYTDNILDYVTTSGLIGNDLLTSITLTGAQTNAGTYNNEIAASAAAIGGQTGNYNITYAPGDLTISQAAITITVTGNTDDVVYTGAEQSVSGYTLDCASPLFNANNVVFNGNDIASGTNVGTYPMGLADNQFSYNDNNITATFNVTDGSLEISTKALAITADDKDKVYGSTDPALTATITDAITDEPVNANISYTMSRGTGETVGEYEITISLGNNPNYSITPYSGTFTITQKDVTITVNNAEKTYGAADPTFTGTVEGLVNDNDLGNITYIRTNDDEDVDTYENVLTASYTANSNYNVTVNKGDFTINPATLAITVTGNTDEVVYNGQVQSVTGYELACESNLYDASKVVFSGNVADSTASGTDVDEYAMGLNANMFSYNDNNFANVTFSVTNGKLTITPATLAITVTGNTDEVVYNGQVQSVTGYELACESNLYDASKVVFSGNITDSTASGTDVNEYAMGLNADLFTYNDANIDATFSVTDGKLTINPLAVTVTIAGAIDTVDYDGTAHTVNGYTATANSNLYRVSGETVDFTFNGEATANRTSAGTTYMELSDEQFTNTNENFNVTFRVTDGHITVEGINVTVTITGTVDTASYDGEPHTANGYTVVISNPLYTTNDFTFNGTAEASQTTVGTAYMGLTAGQFENTNPSFTVTFNVTDGHQTINPINATVTIVGNTNSTAYNGEEHTVSGYTATASTELYNVNSDFTFNGTAEAARTDVDTTFMGLAAYQFANTNPNFATVTFNVTDGYQAITPINATVTIVGNTNSTAYNSEEHSVSGYTATASTELYNVNSDFTFNGTAEAARTDVDTTFMGLAANQFANTNPNFATVTFNVTDGYQAITPINATVTITGANSTVDFDGAAHTVTGYTATTTSTLYNVNSDFTFTPAENATLVNGVIAATRTEAGTTNMGLAATQFTNTNPNFATVTFEVTDGYITINAVDVVVTIKGRVDTVTYDGTAHTVTGYTATANSTLYNVEEDFEFSGNDEVSQTIVGTAYMSLAATQFINTNGNFASVTFNVTDGHITVNPAAITIAADDNGKVYGENDPDELTATVTDVPESGVDPVYSVSRAEGENVGEYAITVTASADANPNYNITTADGVFTITKATATVTANSASKVYGTVNDPELTATVTGLKNDDNASVISYTVSREAGEYVGDYTITPSGAAEQGNYNVEYVTDTFRILPTVVFTTDPMPTAICSEGSISVAFDATISGNNGTMSFAWSRNHTDDVEGTASGTGNIEGLTLTAAATQTVTFTVTPTFTPVEGEAVTGEAATFNVVVNALPAVTEVANNVSCTEMGSAIITVTSTGTFICAWNNGTAAELTQQDNNGHYYTSFSNLSEGQYPYVITDAHQCVTTGTIIIEDPGRIHGTQHLVNNDNYEVNCENLDVLAAVSLVGGTAPYTLQWNNVDNDEPVAMLTTDDMEATHTLGRLAVGEYRLALLITDHFGCTGTASDTLTIVVRPIRTIVREININLSDPTYEYNGHTYNSNEVPPTETYTAANGCDSIISYVVNSYPLDILIADNCTLTRSSYTRAYSNTPRNLLGDTLYVRKNSLATFYAYLQDTELTQWNDEKMDMTYELLFNESGITDGDMPSLVSNFSISSYYDKTGQYYGIANLTAATGEIPNNTLAFRQTANSSILHFDYFYFDAFKNIPNKVTLTGLENGTYTLKLKAELRHSTGGTNRAGIYNPYIVGRKYGHLWGGYNDRPGNREVIAARTFTIIVNETGTNPQHSNATTDIADYTNEASVMAFPNPVNDQLNLRISGMSGATLITITDAHGKVVRTLNAELYGSEEVLTYNVADFAQGMYFINVRNNDTQVSEKFVVTHR